MKKCERSIATCILNKVDVNVDISVKAIIFDFDGVIAESVDVKTRAFRELFKHYPDNVAAIEKFHLENGGMSRFDKFRYIYKNILKKELREEEFSRLCVSFNKLVVEDVVKAPLVKGVKDLLDSYRGTCPMYVVSATPRDEIKEIVKRKGLEDYFLKVYGSPDSKAKSIKQIISDNDYNSIDVLFIGDSRNDLQAALEAGVVFAARVIDKKAQWLKDENIAFAFSEFKELQDCIQFDGR